MPLIPIEVLLVATGFTGALTLVWAVRLVWSRLHPTMTLTPHFSPKGGCTDVIVKELAAARREVLLLAYGFTSRPVAQALVDAKLRGVSVEVILDHSCESDEHTQLHFLVEQGLMPMIDADHASTHNKVAVIDGKTVLTGSFNFTQHAETHNAENLLVIREYPVVARAYQEDCNQHKAHAKAVPGKPAPVVVEEKKTASEHNADVLKSIAQGLAATLNVEEEKPAAVSMGKKKAG